MTNLTNFAKSPTTGFVNNDNGGVVYFNPGAATDISYFTPADAIVILENTQSYYESIQNIDTLDGNGQYYSKSSVIMYSHDDNPSTISRDVQTILSQSNDAFQSLYMTDVSGSSGKQYLSFPSTTFWNMFLQQVNEVAMGNA